MRLTFNGYIVGSVEVKRVGGGSHVAIDTLLRDLHVLFQLTPL